MDKSKDGVSRCDLGGVVAALVIAFGLPIASSANDLEGTRLPRSIVGDWYYTQHTCGSPESEASGVFIDLKGHIDTRNGYETCLVVRWTATDVRVLEEGMLSRWTYEARCISHLPKATGAQAQGPQNTYGTVSLNKDAKTNGLVLTIDRRGNRGGVFAPPENLQMDVLKRCDLR